MIQNTPTYEITLNFQNYRRSQQIILLNMFIYMESDTESHRNIQNINV